MCCVRDARNESWDSSRRKGQNPKNGISCATNPNIRRAEKGRNGQKCAVCATHATNPGIRRAEKGKTRKMAFLAQRIRTFVAQKRAEMDKNVLCARRTQRILGLVAPVGAECDKRCWLGHCGVIGKPAPSAECRGPSRIRTGAGGFAIRCLTTWLRGQESRENSGGPTGCQCSLASCPASPATFFYGFSSSTQTLNPLPPQPRHVS
jgi:hypothetical protein